MRNGEGFLCVYSVDDRESFQEVQQYYQQILRVKDRHNYPCILVANKADLTFDRTVSKQDGS